MRNLIKTFLTKLEEPSQLAIDQLLNAAFLILTGAFPSENEREEITTKILRDLSQ